MVAVLVSGAMAACVAAGVVRESREPRRRSVAEAALLVGGVTVVALLVLSGTAVLAGGGVAVLLVSVTGAGWGAARWSRERRARQALSGPAASSGLDGLDTGALTAEWVRTGALLRGTPSASALQGLVVRRAHVLDELERRDPVGFARWMAAGPLASADPAGFVRVEPPRADPSTETEAA
ncbi:hypothetical protein DQ237_09375 [Blastococcus sp. TF02-8]|nr:hypothetical protein DQ237_09375 [Blastococcus sp. TF02-8]